MIDTKSDDDKGDRDDNSSSLLLQRINTAAVKVLFIILLFRSLGNLDISLHHSYVTPGNLSVMILLHGGLVVVNIFGLLISLLNPLNLKNQLKVLLGINIMKEAGELVTNVFRILLPNQYSPRELSIFNGIENFFWMSMCLAYTRSRWTSNVN